MHVQRERAIEGGQEEEIEMKEGEEDGGNGGRKWERYRV